MSTNGQGRHALVLGASGITGWAIVNSILGGYPDKSAFATVTAVTNRPLSHEASQWPNDSRLQMVSGLDLLAGSQDSLNKAFEQKIPKIGTVSHVYFYGKIMLIPLMPGSSDARGEVLLIYKGLTVHYSLPAER